MRKWRSRILALLPLAIGLQGSAGSAGDIGVGVVPADGTALLAKVLHVPEGTTILGVRFITESGAYPEVLLIRGAQMSLGEGVVVARSNGIVREDQGVNRAVWADPVYVAEAADYCVAVCVPVDRGARMRAQDVADRSGSYLVSGTSGEFTAVSVDLAISLITESAAKAVVERLPDDEVPLRAFLAPIGSRVAGRATVEFGVSRGADVMVTIYDVSGRQVRNLVQGFLDPGTYVREWDGRDGAGKLVAAGVYLVRMQTADDAFTQKLVFMK